MSERQPEALYNLGDQEGQGQEIQVTPEQRAQIESRRDFLASIAKFVGKDFDIPVKLAKPGEGWRWDFQKNEIYVDPQDLLEKPMSYLQFVVAHEGSHRRISRMTEIEPETWQQPGFAFMVNAIEDPRVNNFLSEAYPLMRGRMRSTYDMDAQAEAWAKEQGQDKLGFTPRFVEAGFEYIKQWRHDEAGEDFRLSEDLPEDVRSTLQATLDAAQEAWWTYPSRPEADRGEDTIGRYATDSLSIMEQRIWPEFQKLVEEDKKDAAVAQMLSEVMGGESVGEPSGDGLPQKLKDQLGEAGQQTLSEALQSGKPNLDSLPNDVKQKLQDYFNGLPEDQKQALREKAEELLAQYSKEVAEKLAGKLVEEPSDSPETTKSASIETRQSKPDVRPPTDTSSLRRSLEQLQTDSNRYEEARRELLPIINRLEEDLREIFVARHAHKYQTGFRSGRRINISRRMQEKAQGVPAVQSESWQRRELPTEKDYAITLLADLSGSMRGEKIDETFKAVVVLTEVLNRLSIHLEVLGFTDQIFEYQTYDQQLNSQVRDVMGGMPEVVRSASAAYNDDGWALEQASERLHKRRENEKFLIVLSDGLPEPSEDHDSEEYDLSTVITQILNQGDEKLVGLGIGPGTEHVESYYPNAIADVSVAEMSETLAELIRQVIAEYQRF